MRLAIIPATAIAIASASVSTATLPASRASRAKPALTLEEIYEDAERVIEVSARQWSSTTNVHLHFDNLQQEGRMRLAIVINAGWLEKAKTRGEFFAIFKTAVNNHLRGLIQRYCFTAKRTGQKPPPRRKPGEAYTAADLASTKSVEVSLDDPDAGVQIGAEHEPSSEEFDDDFLTDIKPMLSPVEQMVLLQMVRPNQAALLLAELDSKRGAKGDRKIAVKNCHLAEGLGLEEAFYLSVQNTIRDKVKRYMNPDVSEAHYNAAVTALEEAFGVQVPKNFDRVVVRRIFTIAARDQHDKVTPEIVAQLSAIGAKAPDVKAGQINCFGVLYSRTERACNACGLRNACATEAKNVGLGEITLSSALLGRQMRIPALAAHLTDSSNPQFLSERDEALYDHLVGHFERVTARGEVYFRHREHETAEATTGSTVDGKRGLIFAFDEQLRFRFCDPSDTIQSELVKDKNAWYLPDDSTLEDALRLVAAHAEECFQGQA